MRKKKPNLLESAISQESQEPTSTEQLESMRRRIAVLERSVNMQLTVAETFPAGSPEYATAVQIAESIKETYTDLLLEAALFRLQALLNWDNIAISQTIEAVCDETERIRDSNRQQNPATIRAIEPIPRNYAPPIIDVDPGDEREN